MFKDECAGKTFENFCGLRAKLYSDKMCEDGKTEKRYKGVKTNAIDRTISFDDYKKYLVSQNEQLRKMNAIRNRGHELFTEQIKKVALSSADDKRVICENGI